MNITDALPVTWMEGMTALADKSGPAFFAIFCMVVGIFLLNASGRRMHVAGYLSFFLAAAIITSITLISAANRTYRYDFKIFDAASAATDIENGLGLEIIASEQEDLWLKSRNSVNQFYVIALRDAPFGAGDGFDLYVRNPKTLEMTRHRVDVCDGLSHPLYELRKIADAPEGGDDLEIVSNVDCETTVVNLFGTFGAAFAQSNIQTPLAEKLKLSAASSFALRYYQKSSDQNRVAEAVDQFLENGKDQLPIVRAFSEFSKSPERESNALWFGSEIPADVAADLAIELIENGVELQYFGPYVMADTRINTLEVGYSEIESRSPALSIADVKGLAADFSSR